MSVGSVWDLSSDAELITAVRSGESAAFGVLYERHVTAARAVAHRYSNSAADADDAVQDAFSRVFTAIQSGGGPDVAFRAYLFTVLRRVAMDRVESARRAEPTDDLATFESMGVAVESSEEPTMEGFERGVVSQAYSSLPERWQAVLWYTEVEGLSAAEIAPILGLTANGVAALAYRAREGLRQAYLQQHLAAPQSEACTLVNSKLGAYVRGGLAKRETALVESHLEECHACRALVLELGDVNHGMRVVIGPLVLGAAAVAVLKGIGFGGAAAAAKGAGAAGAASGAAAQSGAGVGSGTGAGAGAATGTGAATGAATGATAGAAAGVTGAAAIAAAASSTTGAAQGAAATAAGTAGAATAGAGAATGGIAGFFAALAGGPALLATFAAIVVVGISVGVAGALGVFGGSGEPPASAGQSQGAVDGGATQTPDSGATEGTGTDTGPTDAPSTGPTDTPTTGTTDGTGTGTGTGATDGAGTGTQPSSAPTSEPTSAPTSEPTPEPTSEPGPPTLSFDPIGSLALAAGEPSPVDIVVRNDTGTTADAVRTEFTFDAGTAWNVTATPGLPAAGLGASLSTATTAWTCARTGATTAVCTLPRLAPHSTATLHTLVQVDDDTLVDATRDLSIQISTWVEGGRRAVETIAARLASAPARVVVSDAAHGAVTGAIDTDESVELTVPVRNVGRTTAKDVTVRVEPPADLPAGVELSQVAVPGTYWTCTPDGGALSCTAPAILPRMPYDLGVRVTVPALAGAALPVTDVDLTTDLTVVAATSTATAPVTVRSAPGQVELSVPDTLVLQRRENHDLAVGLVNVGGTTVTGAGVQVTVPGGAAVAGVRAPQDATCQTQGAVVDCVGVTVRPGAGTDVLLRLTTDSTNAKALGQATARVSGGQSHDVRHTDLEAVVSLLDVSDALTATLVRDASGSASLSVTNRGAGTSHDATVRLWITDTALVTFDDVAGPLGDAGWTCSAASAQDVTCTLPTIAPGQTVPLMVPTTSHVDDAAVRATFHATVTDDVSQAVLVVDPDSVTTASHGLTLRDRWTGGYAVTEIGAPVLTCDAEESGCASALGDLGGSATNNGFDMVPVEGGASADLSVPAGREIVFAGLYWSADRWAPAGGKGDDWTGSLTSVGVRVPGAQADVPVEGAVVARATDDADREYYQSFADVTDLVAAGGSGTWTVDGVATAATRHQANRSYYGGWALVVVYGAPGADQTVSVYDGGAWIGSGSQVTFGFEASGQRDGRIGVVAWDGDRNNDGDGGDTVSLGESHPVKLTPLRRDEAPGSPNDAFTSTAMGSPWANSLGVDAKGFVRVPVDDGINWLTAATSGDQYLIGAVTVTTFPR